MTNLIPNPMFSCGWQKITQIVSFYFIFGKKYLFCAINKGARGEAFGCRKLRVGGPAE